MAEGEAQHEGEVAGLKCVVVEEDADEGEADEEAFAIEEDEGEEA